MQPNILEEKTTCFTFYLTSNLFYMVNNGINITIIYETWNLIYGESLTFTAFCRYNEQHSLCTVEKIPTYIYNFFQDLPCLVLTFSLLVAVTTRYIRYRGAQGRRLKICKNMLCFPIWLSLQGFTSSTIVSARWLTQALSSPFLGRWSLPEQRMLLSIFLMYSF